VGAEWRGCFGLRAHLPPSCPSHQNVGCASGSSVNEAALNMQVPLQSCRSDVSVKTVGKSDGSQDVGPRRDQPMSPINWSEHCPYEIMHTFGNMMGHLDGSYRACS
jgi:hypothetical protein